MKFTVYPSLKSNKLFSTPYEQLVTLRTLLRCPAVESIYIHPEGAGSAALIDALRREGLGKKIVSTPEEIN